MSPLRILHVVPYYEQAWAYGGIPRLATTIARALGRRGHQVSVYTTDACDAVSRTTHEGRGPMDRLVDVRVFPNVSNRLAYHWQFFTPVGLAAHVRQTASGFDVAHLHACHNLPSALAARALADAGVPYVLSPNGTAVPIERRIAAKRLFAATIGRGLLRDARFVLAVTDVERRQLLRAGVDAARIVTVPNPVDVTEFERTPDSGGFRAQHGLAKGPLVLYLGKLTPRKGVEGLVHAFAALEDEAARLVIAGSDMGTGAAVRAAATRAGVAHRVTHTGLLRGSARLDALAAASVVVYPSRDEIFGLVPLEALLSGTPVVVSDDSGCAEVIARTGGGLTVPFGDPRLLSQAIASVLADQDRWRAAARDAARRVRALFGADIVCGQLERVYADATAACAARAGVPA